ncbi:MAG: bifunctional proline dehydrogenase/L-glutamate gamma-semialdehyde dehydrogenase PutA [Alphaproteobacteria bacterium]|nr:bifunctional proline dehydrogenase/L-glutamate gamma-semialdehyde dehydrogenase PutA [Alphaproteobacteria bacterium]
MSISFSSCFERSEAQSVERLLEQIEWDGRRAHAAQQRASGLVEALRARRQPAGQLESFLQDYSLNTDEGLALMALAEALLRIPDKKTAYALIRDKVAAANWLEASGGSKDMVVKAAGLGLFMTSKTLDGVLGRVGEPFMHQAMLKAMRILGKQFVLGRDIEEAMQNAQNLEKQGLRLSYDMLGEGARTSDDAQRYFESYAAAIDYIGARRPLAAASDDRRPGVSVKLSALHPRYEPAQADLCVPAMAERLGDLAELAARHDLMMTIDAEESWRLDLSFQVIEKALERDALKGWDGFGLAVQAYHKAAMKAVRHVQELAEARKQRLHIRLVKGAYWDSEIKNTQVAGLSQFPVYTRKSHTDLSYLTCASQMFKARGFLYPMFGTHNAHSVAAISEMAADHGGAAFEFQRLFGMGQGLYEVLAARDPSAKVSVYAPVGPHEDLLPYLVRRLLENGANTSFVNRIMSQDAPVEELVADPVDTIRQHGEFKHPRISLPEGLFQDEEPMGRCNSSGVDLHATGAVSDLREKMAVFYKKSYEAMPIINGQVGGQRGVAQDVVNPADLSDVVGRMVPASDTDVQRAFTVADECFADWAGRSAGERADILERLADLYESRRAELMALLVREAGRSLRDAHDEVREAVDFCRYYAAQGRGLFADAGQVMPGPVGERNVLTLHGRGSFVCISPWNFPLAIFTGQIAAALMAGNCVLAKPAEQAPLIGALSARMMREAGVPDGALQLLPGDGHVGAMLTAHPRCAGVAFTGSVPVARAINRSLADRNGAIAPLIAETGGQNIMVVDSSALPEQVVDDVMRSAFGSAGQRCSALRILCLQEEIADKILRILKGAMVHLRIGDPLDISSDLGPVIDEEARAKLMHHRKALDGFGKLIAEVPLSEGLKARGCFFAPCAYEVNGLKGLEEEVFGPILHVVRYRRDKLDELLDEVKALGYGLTLGIHSRIDAFHDYVVAKMPVGNIYVNRSMIGAVVGSQPFGGMGLSGTGPKAGGPHYLARFASEKLVSTNTAAAGGNASLVSLSE